MPKYCSAGTAKSTLSMDISKPNDTPVPKRMRMLNASGFREARTLSVDMDIVAKSAMKSSNKALVIDSIKE